MSEKFVSDLVKYDDIQFAVQAKDSVHGPIPLHWHSYYEVELFVSGGATHIADGKIYEFSPGCVSVMKPTDFHSYNPKGETFGVRKFILMPEKVGAKIRTLLDRLPCALDVGEKSTRFEKMFDELIESCGNRSESGCLLSQNLAERIIIELTMCEENAYVSESVSDRTERLSRVLCYISEHFTERLSLADAAREVSVNPDYLSRYFSKELGTTFSNYLKMKRLAYATSLLMTGDYSIEEIAGSSGFPSLTFFNRVFRARYGMSPAEYRRMMREGG